MAPMTRSRAIGNIPNDLMARYYGQRTGAGLIITEGTSPSPNGLGYARIPGIFSDLQIEGWKKVTMVVHRGGSRIFIQLMHTGRIGHPLNLPEGARVLALSAVKPKGQIWTDRLKMQDYPSPEEMTSGEIEQTVMEYITAAKNSIEAGFDGVELHGANGYLFEQFLSPVSNVRTDNYGGNLENRCRFVLEVVRGIAEAVGKLKTGIRLSPYGLAGDMHHYPEIASTYKYLAEQVNSIGIGYIHIAKQISQEVSQELEEIKKLIRQVFKNTIILTGGYDLEKAESDIQSGRSDLIAFGRLFINNPDLVERFTNRWPLSELLDRSLFYTPGEKGYIDYPNYKL
jgi:N-ethylmaleimide reductase